MADTIPSVDDPTDQTTPDVSAIEALTSISSDAKTAIETALTSLKTFIVQTDGQSMEHTDWMYIQKNIADRLAAQVDVIYDAVDAVTEA